MPWRWPVSAWGGRRGGGDRWCGAGCQNVERCAPRNSLIAKGMLYSPAHGDVAFTVPLFDAFMRRVMPKASPLWFYFKFLSMFLV